MGLSLNGLQVFYKPWFDGTPQNAKYASATLTFTGVVVDEETVTIGDNVYEFDDDGEVAEDNIAVDVSALLPRAEGTLTFTDVPIDGDKVTIGDDVYEFDGNDTITDGNIPVVLGDQATVGDVITALLDAIADNNDSVVEAAKVENEDKIVVIALEGGTAGNSIAISTTSANLSWDDTNLQGGADSVAKEDAAAALLAAIKSNDNEVVDGTLVAGDNSVSLVVQYNIVGTEGNSVAVDVDATNISWGQDTKGDDITSLSGGQFATPCRASKAVIVIDNTIYFTVKPVDKFTTDGWYAASPSLL